MVPRCNRARSAASLSADLRIFIFQPYHRETKNPLVVRYGLSLVNRVHDRTLELFIADRMAAGVTATTINRSLEVVRTILNCAAWSYRDDDGRPWLDALPPVTFK